MFTDTNALQKLSSQLKKTDKTLWGKIKSFFGEWIAKLKKAYAGMSPDSELAKIARDALKNAENLQQLWVDAAVEAAQNYRQAPEGQKNNTAGGDVCMFSLRKDENIEEKNIRNGNNAIDKLISDAETASDPKNLSVKNAMYRSDIGYIDFKWGSPGIGNKFKHGFGLSHIIAKRNFENGSGVQTAHKIVEVIAKATQADRQGNDFTKPEDMRIRLYYDNFAAVLSNGGDGNHWLLTGWEEKNKTAAFATGEGYDSSRATAAKPTPTRLGGVDATVSDETVPHPDDSVKLKSTRDSDGNSLSSKRTADDRMYEIAAEVGEKIDSGEVSEGQKNNTAGGDVFDIVENSAYKKSALDTKNHKAKDGFTEYFDSFYKTVQIDGKVFDIDIDVKKQIGSKHGYTYTIKLRDNTTMKASPAVTDLQPLRGQGTPSDTNVTHPDDSVNLKSTRDSDGNSLSKAQQEYFKDSKVRDEDGNLLAVYQATDGSFTVFDRRKLGTVTINNAQEAAIAATAHA